MLKRVLGEARDELLREERRLLGELRVVLVRHEAPADVQKALVGSISQLDELFMLVVVGEWNAGKSSVINTLLGEAILEEGPTPTTARIAALKYGLVESRSATGSYEVIALPRPILLGLSIVDTPGTNAVVREHETLTRDFVPRSDLVLFVTSADRPFTESERQFLEAIQSWGKKVLVAVNKVDILEAKDVSTVVEFVRKNALELLGLRPQVFAVSARQARQARAEADDGLWRRSGFAALEAFVSETLNDGVRLRLKLLSPLGVGLKALEETGRGVEARLSRLDQERRSLDEVDRERARQREDLLRGVRLRLSDVDKIVLEFERRGRGFLDASLRLGRALDLVHAERLRLGFESQVLGELPRLVEQRVEEIAGWMVAQRVADWEIVRERLERTVVHRPRAGSSEPEAPYDPSQPPSSARRDVQRVLEAHDPRAQAARLAEQSRAAIVATLALLIGGLGVAVASLVGAESLAGRLGGLVVAGALTSAGLLLVALLRVRARLSLGESASALRSALGVRLRSRFEQETDEDRRRAQAVIEPRRAAVRSESERLQAQHGELGTVRKALEALRARIESL